MPELAKFKFSKFHHRVAESLPEPVHNALANLDFEPRATKATDLRVVVAMSTTAATQRLAAISKDHLLAFDGHVYLFYPKATSQQFKGISRDAMLQALQFDRRTGLLGNSGFKYLSMLSFDDNFTVIDLKWAEAVATKTRLADYDAQVPQLFARLTKQNAKLAKQWHALTPAMQSQWARYIYSPKRLVTQKMHFEQMLVVLASGHRTLEEYMGAR
ncbi:YdeI/OmpD-associated family protein [Lacticaseibacillus porcinae]|uniref:YdeI/OmpD-associated family protein n=1 Tax=Lacticaseibacillus porcinae TaxID=1123687 RepID=UPI000F7A78E8|nr:YdeI/OmpD-associated family protein [Lacticaseibacillus porcinae]